MMEQTWQELSLGLKRYNLKGTNSAIASCPAHEDQTPSLSLEKKKEIILLKCHAGCSFKEIIEALGMTRKEFKAQKKAKPIKKEVCRNDYQDEHGKTLGQVVRFSPKAFLRVRQVDEKDVWNLEPEDLVVLTVEAAAIAQVPLCGTDWIPGKTKNNFKVILENIF